MILYVRHAGMVVGVLGFDTDRQRWSFAYDPAWLTRKDRFALSPPLPFEAGDPESHSRAVRTFFENLLPEGQALDDAAATYKLSKANTAGLIQALGRESAGALEIVASPTSVHGAANRRHVSRDELVQRIRARPQQSFTVWDNRVRLSIAGFQDKIAVLSDAAQWFLVDGGGLASTHLIKPDPVNPALAGLTTNERVCMQLATTIGLPAAPTQLLRLPEPVLVVERFDRIANAGAVQRLHCIDGCQALNLPVAMKYEQNFGNGADVRHIRDGARLPALFALLDAHAMVPVQERVALLRWAIFQTLIGNVDAHGKNVMFFFSSTGLRLAPAYDLVCGLLYNSNGVDDTLAMAIGDEFQPRVLAPYDWAAMASNCSLGVRLVAQELQRMATACLDNLPRASETVAAEQGDRQVIAAVVAVVREQAERALQVAPLIVRAAR